MMRRFALSLAAGFLLIFPLQGSDLQDSAPANQDAEKSYNQGQEGLQKKDFDKAIEYLSEAIRLDPKNDSAYMARSIAYEKKGDSKSALADCTKLIELQPNNAGFHLRRGGLYFALNILMKPSPTCPRRSS